MELVAHVVFIAIAFYALQALKLEEMVKKGRIFQARILFILLTIALGSIVAQFFLSLTRWSQQLPYLI
ncbi:DUF1146 family protein [Lysinibacillus alkalisoli]|uniref:DUF1146 family protein n=1 Tax=Lysinibacillus alkalisoli TaxID=1911548 RepID=UPI0027E45999|nr:DUF1146 family protein [Lysinibacillus alkalisoli]